MRRHVDFLRQAPTLAAGTPRYRPSRSAANAAAFVPCGIKYACPVIILHAIRRLDTLRRLQASASCYFLWRKGRSSMRLTVASPTYNRNEVLRASLERLLPQLTDECELLLVDNHSDVPVEQTLRDLLASYPDVRCRIVRNRFNIGGAANILRCFELCETPWLWLLGDDDRPTPDAICLVFQHLQDHPDACFFNFVSYHFRRSRKRVTVGCEDFIRKFDDWSNLLFMSVGVFHCPTVMPQLRFGYQYMYSSAPHIAMMLASLDENARCVLSDGCIIQHQSPGGWAPVIALLGKMSLLDLPMKQSTRQILAGKLRSKPSLEATAVILLHAAQAHGDFRE